MLACSYSFGFVLVLLIAFLLSFDFVLLNSFLEILGFQLICELIIGFSKRGKEVTWTSILFMSCNVAVLVLPLELVRLCLALSLKIMHTTGCTTTTHVHMVPSKIDKGGVQYIISRIT